jgi:Endoribonuclease L-PSP
LASILEAAGASMSDLVKVTIFYTDVDNFAKLNQVYAAYMPDPRQRARHRQTSDFHTGCSYRSTPSRHSRPTLTGRKPIGFHQPTTRRTRVPDGPIG